MADCTSSKQCCCESEEQYGGPVFEPRLYIQRYYFVQQQLIKHKASSVVDFGSAECKISRFLVRVPTLEKIAMVDIDQGLLTANRHVIRPQAYDYLDRRERPLELKILCGSVTEMDKSVVDYDALTMVEVIEHLYPDTLAAARDTVFGRLQPRIVVFTTPNSEFNVLFPGFSGFRHYDHKFEWTREEFQDWCGAITDQYPYTVQYEGIGDPPPDREDVGPCSQAAVFVRNSDIPNHSQTTSVSDTYKLIAGSTYPHKKTSDLTEEDAMLMELNYLLRQHSLSTRLKQQQHSPTGTSHLVTNDNQSNDINTITDKYLSTSQNDKLQNNEGTSHITLQNEQGSSQFENQTGSSKNVTSEDCISVTEHLNTDDSLNFKCELCKSQSEDCNESGLCLEYESDSSKCADKTSDVLYENRGENTTEEDQDILDTDVCDKYREYLAAQHPHSALKSNLTSGKDSDIKACNALMSESVPEPHTVDFSKYEGSDKVFDTGIDLEEETYFDDDDETVMVPITDLLKYKCINLKFDEEQLRTFLLEHSYTLSLDLSCVVCTVEEEMTSDEEVEEEEEYLQTILRDNLAHTDDNSEREIKKTSSFTDFETECWD